MIVSKATVLLVLGSLALTSAFNTLVPWDKELIYNYQALVKAGTHLPVSYASQFILEGKLHLQANNNATLVKLTDLTYKIYNGPLNHVDEHIHHEQVPLPEELKHLQTVFKIVYDTHGKAMGISTDQQEKEYTRNIKKAIAAILQLDVEEVVKTVHHHPHAFITQEHTIHGVSTVNYNVLPHDQWTEVHKLLEVPSTHWLYHHMFPVKTWQNSCEVPFDDPISSDSQRKYTIVKQGDHHVVKHIEANGGIYYYPYKGQSEAQYLFTNQTFHLIETVPVKEQFHVQSEHWEHDLTYHMLDGTLDGEWHHDITNGRRHVDVEKWVPTVHKMLEDIWVYLHADHIHMGTPNMKEGQLISRLIRLLGHFDYDHLLQLHSTIKQQHPEHHEEILQVYHQVLPLIGTKASVLVIKHLISQQLVSQLVAVELLGGFAKHVKVPTKQLLTELEEILHWGDKIHWSVRKAAIIAFGSLVYHTHSLDKIVHRNQHFAHAQPNDHIDDDVKVNLLGAVDVHESDHHLENYYEKYVTLYINKLRGTTQFKEQIAYLSGLFNMKLHSVVTHLIPAIKGEWWQDHHHRLMAIWAVSPVILQNPDEVFKILWPIFTNPHEHTELRIISYYLIMESEVTVSRLSNIYWYMQHEQNHEVYNFYWTHINSLAHSKESCKSVLKVHAAQILKYIHPSSHGLSSYHLGDYVDAKYGFNMGYHGLLINTNTSIILSGYVTQQIFHEIVENTMVYVKIHGSENIDDDFKLNTQSSGGLFNFDQFTKIWSNLKQNGDFHIEISVTRHGEIVNSWYIDSSNIEELSSLLQIWEKHTIHKDVIKILHEKYELYIPTDLGFPALWTWETPLASKYQLQVTNELVNNVLSVHIDNNYAAWMHSKHGLSFYNPILDVFQGIHKIHSYDSVSPINLDLVVNWAQKSLKISTKAHNNVEKDVWGLRSHVGSVVFVRDDLQKGILKQLPNYVLVSHGEHVHSNEVQAHHLHRHNYTIVDEENFNTGSHIFVSIFDSDKHVSNGTWLHGWYMATQPYTKHFETPLAYHWLSYSNWQHYIVLQPSPGVHGVLVRVEPSKERPVSTLELSLRWNHEIQHGGYLYTPGFKFSTRATYSIKNQATSLKTWDVNAVLDLNPGHTVNNLKMHFTRIVPGQKDYKVCVEGVKKYSHEKVTGHLNIAMSLTPDGKCVQDDTVIDVTMTGEPSKEQIEQSHLYGACQYAVPYSIQHFHTLQCLQAHTSVRKYVYNVKTAHVPTEFKKYFWHFWDVIKGYHLSYYNFVDEHGLNIEEHSGRVEVLYPMTGNEVDVNIYTPQHWYSLTGVPTHYWQHYGVQPDTLTYPKSFVWLHALGLVDHCSISNASVHYNEHHWEHHVPSDWTLYLADVVQNPKYAIFVKEIGHHELAVKIVDHSHVLEILPEGITQKITVDGQKVDNAKVHWAQDWVSLHVYTEEATVPVAIWLPHSGLHVEYDNHHVQVIIPKVDHHWHGQCLEH